MLSLIDEFKREKLTYKNLIDPKTLKFDFLKLLTDKVFSLKEMNYLWKYEITKGD